jgi:hypothetical protein
MSARARLKLARTMRHVFRRARRRIQRSAEAQFRLIGDEKELARSAYLLAHYANGSPILVHSMLARLWALNCTTLYVHIHELSSPADVVLCRHSGQRVVASGQKFRVETEFHEPAPDGAYLVERQYRQLGLYETPPAERAIVALWITAGSGGAYVVDIPHYVSHATVVVNNRTVVDAVAIPTRGELRYSLNGN